MTDPTPGVVYLVGAGPGDPGLLTLRGAELLRRADVVVHDRLAPAELLSLAPEGAEVVDVGKRPGDASRSQEAVNKLLVERALQGKLVVRLKGGDPFVFGRGGEEALACAEAGVPFEVVPGVSAAIAAPAYAGVPVTQRAMAASFAVVTASRTGGINPDLNRVATAVDTLVLLMAAGRLREVCEALIAAGRSGDDPALVVQWAATPRQRSAAGPLAKLPELATDEGIGAPATLVVGAVAGLAGQLQWFPNSSPI
jgi:uroporphyrin-III C-methyltransferase